VHGSVKSEIFGNLWHHPEVSGFLGSIKKKSVRNSGKMTGVAENHQSSLPAKEAGLFKRLLVCGIGRTENFSHGLFQAEEKMVEFFGHFGRNSRIAANATLSLNLQFL
jgi:hypothetical protein